MADDVERFSPTSGRLSGVIALLICGSIVVLGLFFDGSGVAPWATAAAAFGGVVSWVALLRPGLGVTDRSLVLRNMLETVSIPLPAIDSVAVQQVTAIGVGDKRYVSAAIGRSRRAVREDTRAPSGKTSRSRFGGVGFGVLSFNVEEPSSTGRRTHVPRAAQSYGYFVQERILRAVADAKVRPATDEEVERRPAWIEIGLLVVTALATVMLIVV